jgi:tetratricopeptide (TPR) repeat protein
MQDALRKAIEKQEVAKSSRKKGDALRKAGRTDAALAAYRSGLDALNEALGMLAVPREQLRLESKESVPADLREALKELVEVLGALGGMHQRIGSLDEALSSYRDGAALEEQFGLPTTYNRLNAVKLSLVTGYEPLRAMEAKISDLAGFIESTLRADQKLSDSGWAWADLGDCLALLGRADDAGNAYATFIAKAEIKSPERTLDVLKEVAAKLQSLNDPDVARVLAAIDALQTKLVAKQGT